MAAAVIKLKEPSNQETASLACRVWGLDWNKHFPMILPSGIRVESLTYAAAGPIIAKLFPEIYQIDKMETRFQEQNSTEHKQRYYEIAGDYFVFYDTKSNDKIAGMAAGTLLDWSGYNFRNISIAPDYQGHGIYLDFTEILAKLLKTHGVRRIEGDVAPSNKHHIHVLNKIGYMVTSMSFSERWGVLLHITRYLEEEDEVRCTQLFSMTSASDLLANIKKRA